MNPSIKEMVDAAVKELMRQMQLNIETLGRTDSTLEMVVEETLTSITEKAVASERARIREGVEAKIQEARRHFGPKGSRGTIVCWLCIEDERCTHEDEIRTLTAVLALLSTPTKEEKKPCDKCIIPSHGFQTYHEKDCGCLCHSSNKEI